MSEKPPDCAGGLSDAARAAVAAWTAGEHFGLLLTGDPLRCECLWTSLTEQLAPGTPAVGPGTELGALFDAPDVWTTAPRPGILARAARGALLLPAVHLLDPAQAAAVARVPRILARAPSLADVPAVLVGRLAAVLELPAHPDGVATLRTELGAATPLLRWTTEGVPRVPPAGGDIVGLLDRYGLIDASLDLGAARLARAVARLGVDGLDVVERLVCAPRSAPESPPRGPSADESADGPDAADEGSSNEDSGPRDSVDSGTTATAGRERGEPDSPLHDPEPPADVSPTALPPPSQVRRTTRTRLAGRRGASAVHPSRGRRHRVVSLAAAGGRPDVMATLLAAAPWQHARRVPGACHVVVCAEDLRGRSRRHPAGRLTVLVVDVSGSMARDAIRQAKAFALHLLDRAYRDRSTVCIVLARGSAGVIGLPPTRSTARARAALRALPTGGGTPLASALLLAAEVASRHDPAQVEAVVMTDGRANVGVGGDPKDDAVRAARQLASSCSVVRLHATLSRYRRDDTRWLAAAFDLGALDPGGPDRGPDRDPEPRRRPAYS